MRKIDHHHCSGVPCDICGPDPRDAEIARLKAERDEARASEASIRASAIRHDDANNETIRVLTKKHDAALAACAEMRAALEGVLSEHEARVGECNCGICYPIHALLKKGGG